MQTARRRSLRLHPNTEQRCGQVAEALAGCIVQQQGVDSRISRCPAGSGRLLERRENGQPLAYLITRLSGLGPAVDPGPLARLNARWISATLTRPSCAVRLVQLREERITTPTLTPPNSHGLGARLPTATAALERLRAHWELAAVAQFVTCFGRGCGVENLYTEVVVAVARPAGAN